MLKIKFKSLLNIFFLKLILKTLIVKNSYTTNATGQIITAGCTFNSLCVSTIRKAETKKPNAKLPESPKNCLGNMFRKLKVKKCINN